MLCSYSTGAAYGPANRALVTRSMMISSSGTTGKSCAPFNLIHVIYSNSCIYIACSKSCIHITLHDCPPSSLTCHHLSFQYDGADAQDPTTDEGDGNSTGSSNCERERERERERDRQKHLLWPGRSSHISSISMLNAWCARVRMSTVYVHQNTHTHTQPSLTPYV